MEFFIFEELTRWLLRYTTGDLYDTRYWINFLVGGICYLVLFALEAVALYTLAKKGGYKNKWMAFVPFFNTYYIGVLADKNKLFNVKIKTFSLVLAIIEVAYVAIRILNVVAITMLFNGGYLEPIFVDVPITDGTMPIFTGAYSISENLPANLYWTSWVYSDMADYIEPIIDLAYIVLSVFVISSFYRTYAPSHYILYTIICVLFPINAIFMFTVRNKTGVSYSQYVRGVQQKRYAQYQEYMRNAQGGSNANNANNANTGTNSGNAGADNDPFGNLGSRPEDPFNGLGENSNNNEKKD
ncbi:MAG: hypothetical protein ACI4MS_00805 [Candidatus Coproplasma sp.]